MRDPVRHPVTLVLGILRIFGGFPYVLRRIPRTGTDIRRVEQHRASKYSAGGGKKEEDDDDDEVVVERSVVAGVWSGLLALLLVANNMLYLCRMDYGGKDTWTVISTLVQVSLCLVAALVQVYLVLYSQELALILARMTQVKVHLTGGFLRRQFLPLYLLVGTELLLSSFKSLMTATKLFSGVIPRSPLYISSFLLLSLYPPVSCLGSYGLLHAVCITLDVEMEERFLQYDDDDDDPCDGRATLSCCLKDCTTLRKTLKHRGNTILPVLAATTTTIITTTTTTPSAPNTTRSQSTGRSRRDLERLRRADWKAFVRFVSDADDIVEWLMRQQGVVVLLVSLQTLTATLTILYGFLSDVHEDISHQDLLVHLLKLLAIVCTPDIINGKRGRCLRAFRRLTIVPTSDAEAREAERVVSVLENGPSYSVCGLFSLGRHCIIPVISCLATYLIIAVQFRTSEGTPDPALGNSTA